MRIIGGPFSWEMPSLPHAFVSGGNFECSLSSSIIIQRLSGAPSQTFPLVYSAFLSVSVIKEPCIHSFTLSFRPILFHLVCCDLGCDHFETVRMRATLPVNFDLSSPSIKERFIARRYSSDRLCLFSPSITLPSASPLKPIHQFKLKENRIKPKLRAQNGHCHQTDFNQNWMFQTEASSV